MNNNQKLILTFMNEIFENNNDYPIQAIARTYSEIIKHLPINLKLNKAYLELTNEEESQVIQQFLKQFHGMR